VQRPELSPDEQAEIEAIAAQVLAEAPPESWPRKPLRNLLQRGREQALHRAYVRGIIDGAFYTQQRLAADPGTLDRWFAAVNAGVTPDWGLPNAALILKRTDYADFNEWMAAIERYAVGYGRAVLALALERFRAAQTT
jgi:hypothetical protein